MSCSFALAGCFTGKHAMHQELKAVAMNCAVEGVIESKRPYGLIVRLAEAAVSPKVEHRVDLAALPLLRDLNLRVSVS